MNSDEIIAWTRFGVLFLALGIAAWLDHKDRRIPNEFWINWSKPAIFLWAIDLMNQEAEWYIYATAAGVIAYASIAVIGNPSLKDIAKGSPIDIGVSLWYLVGVAGIVQGVLIHSSELPLNIIFELGDAQSILWWSTVAVLLPIFLVDMAWRFRLIHGGADSKGLMWVAILIPSWSAVPVLYPEALNETIFVLPPAIALLIWGGFAFLLLPVIMTFRNFKAGHFNPKLFWHAERMDIDLVADKHVWMLTGLIEMPDGESKIIHRVRAPKRTPSAKQVAKTIQELKDLGIVRVWVTQKYPLLLFLWPALIPLLLVGGPMAFIMPLLGL